MRVLVSHRGYWPALAGAEQMADRTAAALADRGHRVLLVRMASGRPPGHPAEAGVEVVEVRSAHSQESACAGFKPDVVHAVDVVHREFAEQALALARRLRVPFALTPASAPAFWEDRVAGLALCEAADALFCLTEAERLELSSAGVEGARIHLIPQAPALLGAGDAARFRARHRIDGPIVLFLGRKARSKGYRELLEAAAEVWRAVPSATVVLAGSAWDEDCEAVLARHRDRRILDLGPVDDAEKEDALAACAVLCLPSSEDVAPLVYAEAWSYGKPVIAGPFPGVAELVKDGSDGLIVAREPQAIAAAIVALLGDEARGATMGVRGRAKVQAGLSWAAVAARVECVYGRLASCPSPLIASH